MYKFKFEQQESINRSGKLSRSQQIHQMKYIHRVQFGGGTIMYCYLFAQAFVSFCLLVCCCYIVGEHSHEFTIDQN